MSDKGFIGLDTMIVQVEGLVSSDMDGETVLLNVASGNYFGMDPVGSRIWALIEQPQVVARLCEALLDEFDVERDQCKRDVLAYLDKLFEAGLIKISDGAAH